MISLDQSPTTRTAAAAGAAESTARRRPVSSKGRPHAARGPSDLSETNQHKSRNGSVAGDAGNTMTLDPYELAEWAAEVLAKRIGRVHHVRGGGPRLGMAGCHGQARDDRDRALDRGAPSVLPADGRRSRRSDPFGRRRRPTSSRPPRPGPPLRGTLPGGGRPPNPRRGARRMPGRRPHERRRRSRPGDASGPGGAHPRPDQPDRRVAAFGTAATEEVRTAFRRPHRALLRGTARPRPRGRPLAHRRCLRGPRRTPVRDARRDRDAARCPARSSSGCRPPSKRSRRVTWAPRCSASRSSRTTPRVSPTRRSTTSRCSRPAPPLPPPSPY